MIDRHCLNVPIVNLPLTRWQMVPWPYFTTTTRKAAAMAAGLTRLKNFINSLMVRPQLIQTFNSIITLFLLRLFYCSLWSPFSFLTRVLADFSRFWISDFWAYWLSNLHAQASNIHASCFLGPLGPVVFAFGSEQNCYWGNCYCHSFVVLA